MRHTIVGVTLGVIGGILLSFAYLAEAEPIIVVQPVVEEEVQIEVRVDWTHERITQEIESVAEEYEVSSEVMKKVIRCESQYNPRALGDHGHSRGLVQIHNSFHDVSDEDAYNPAYAIRFLAEHLRDGNGHLWTCYRELIK